MSFNEWVEYKLGDICTDISYGYTASADWEIEGPKFLRITDIQDYFINWNTVPQCQISESDKKKYLLETGDIVIARTGASTGSTFTLKDEVDAVFASYLIRYKIDSKIANPFYIGYLLKSSKWKEYVSSIIGGSAQPGANAKQFSDFDFILPDISIQSKIVDLLSAIDDKIENNLATNQTLEEIARTLFKEWFVNFNYPNADGNIKQSEFGDIPESWEVGTLGDIYKTTSGGTPSRSKPEYYENGSIGWVKSKELNNSFIIDTEEKITEDALKNSSAKLLPKHSVLIAMYGATVGEIGIITDEFTCNQAICAFLPNEQYPFTFIYDFLLNSKQDIISRAVGSAQQNISQQLLLQYKLVVPPSELVQEYHRIVFPLFQKIQDNIEENENLKDLRDSLLPKLMSGEIIVTPSITQ